MMIWFGEMYWKPARPPMLAVSIEILDTKRGGSVWCGAAGGSHNFKV